MDFKRQENDVIDVKSEDVYLRVYFKDYLKKYGILFSFFLLLALFSFKDFPLGWIITLFTCLICFILIFILYFFQSYQVRYDSFKKNLIIKRWYGTINIPKSKLKKVYVKTSRAGTNFYIGYLDDENR